MTSREYHNAWYEKNKTKRRAQLNKYGKDSQNRNRRYILEYLREHPCIDCGESDPIVLEFDHIIGTKSYDVAAMVRGYSIAKIQTEIDKCVIRCANCHRRKTYYQLNRTGKT